MREALDEPGAARRIGHPVDGESFNPVLVGFYQTVGYLPDAIVNYLLLLGWSSSPASNPHTRALS